MAKIHLRRNTNPENRAIAACASNPHIKSPRRNGRATYQFMASEIVSVEEFRKVAPADRCAHCCEAALVIRNRQRALKGMPPVAAWDAPPGVQLALVS